jgi:hypothetical protein
MGNVEFAAFFMTGIKDIPYLGEAEGHCTVCLDGGAHDFTRIAVYPGGDIEAEDPFTSLIDQINYFPVQSPDIPVESRSEDGIHYPIGMPDNPTQFSARFQILDLQRQKGQHIQVGLGRPLEAPWITQDINLRGPPVGENFPGHHESVAPVVSDTAQNGIPLSVQSPLPGKYSSGPLTGILHKNLGGYLQGFRGMAIHPAHFLNTGDFHRFPLTKKTFSFFYILLQ